MRFVPAPEPERQNHQRQGSADRNGPGMKDGTDKAATDNQGKSKGPNRIGPQLVPMFGNGIENRGGQYLAMSGAQAGYNGRICLLPTGIAPVNRGRVQVVVSGRR